MAWPWVILARVPRVLAGEEPAGGEDEAQVDADAQADGDDEAEELDAGAEVEADAQGEAADEAEDLDSEAEVEEDAEAVDEEELDAGMEDEADELAEAVDEAAGLESEEEEVDADEQAEGDDEAAELDSEEEEVGEEEQAEAEELDSEEEEVEEDEQAEAVDEAEEVDSEEEEVEEDEQAEAVDEAEELDSEEEDVDADEQAEAVDEAEELDPEEDVDADEQAQGDGEAGVERRADFSIPVALPPRINVMTAASTAHPDRNSPDKYPYILGVGSGCILFNFSAEPFYGVCLDDRPYQSNLVMVHHFDSSGVEQGHPVRGRATVERIPPRDGNHAVVSNIQSIGFVSIGHGKSFVIAELMVHRGRERAMLVYYFHAYAGPKMMWQQETTRNPLPHDDGRDGDWVPSGVVSYKKMLWWFDLSWGVISFHPFHELDVEEPPLLFHRLPAGRALNKAPPNIHDHRCIAESQGGLRYVEIIVPEPEGEAATVSMWSWIPAADGNHETIVWDMGYATSFPDIWDDDSYKATRLPRKVPVLVLVCPTDANLVYFAMEDEERIFSVNVPERRLVDFIDDSYQLVTPWPAAPSCRYVLPWFLPLQVAQVVGMDPFADSDAEQLKKEYAITLGDVLIVEIDGEDKFNYDDLARLRSEAKKLLKDHEGSQSQGPGLGDDAGRGACL